jgi:hypothetical protein
LINNLHKKGLTPFLVFFVLAGSVATARDIHYGAVADADVVACDRLHWTGQVDASRNCYADLLRNSGSLSARAEAAWALKEARREQSIRYAGRGPGAGGQFR